MVAVQTRRSAHHTNLGIGRNLFDLGWQRKPEDRALTDPNYERTAVADAALGTRLNRAGEKADPGHFLGEFRSVEIQASAPEKREWAVITRRNVPGYPPHRSDTFATRTEALNYYKKVVVETPRVSLGNQSPNPSPTLDDYTAWLLAKNLYDPILNPDAPVNPDA